MAEEFSYIAIGLAIIALVLAIIDPSAINGSLYVKDLTADTFILTSTVEDDIRVNAETLKILGSLNIPDWVAFINGTQALAFDKDTMEQAFTSVQLPHSRKDNSNINPHFHLTGKTNAVGNASFCLEYSCSNINGVFPSTNTVCGLAQFDGTINKHYIVYTTPISNNLTGSAMCMLRIYRNATAAIDNYAADALLMEFDIHIDKDKLGANI